ncbi:exodeoxyribonuclease V subunit alpha [Chlorobium sp. N1]|uniref:exodeoxyribonuclease V subunit alpha n=1 Tax=Chlorobium sp. N1 TaxID=2491138 RepID=UPI001038F8FB|nr:exodeoxyribonuclease V subunit alpha [Chlorobium sp. N1]TCD48341.1 exodeoxyribonuclease V subunit alpha [Chlorobium sp. N1]
MREIRHEEQRPIDRQFASFVAAHGPAPRDPLLYTLSSLVSAAVGRGDVCLDLAAVAGSVVLMPGGRVEVPKLGRLLVRLKESGMVSEGDERTPLVIGRGSRLYLQRYWAAESDLARRILDRCRQPAPFADPAGFEARLGRLFGEGGMQREAARNAAGRSFSVLAGGPGTGKTSTVVRILALLAGEDGLGGGRIAMAAPTGKAALRLGNSVRLQKAGLDCSEAARRAIPDEATTLHRLLGAVPGSGRFRHGPRSPLPFDTVVVDEASMVALPLMHAFVSALAPGCRLILLGDPDQLASVEAGAVLGDICDAGAVEGSPLSGSITLLSRNYRFDADAGISLLARAVNEGRAEDALGILEGRRGVVLRPPFGAETDREGRNGELEAALLDGYRPYLEAGESGDALRLFERFRILSALREGPGLLGVNGLNAAAERILLRHGLIERSSPFYHGRPVMVTENSYSMRLFNGDTGIVLMGPGGTGPMVWFPAPDGSVRAVAPERLPRHETAYAVTIHKSQGSEFDGVLMVLPDSDSPLLTRELLYTGITRARHSVEIRATVETLRAATLRPTERISGLREALLDP